MIPPKLHDSLIERSERVAALTAEIQPLFDAGHAGFIVSSNLSRPGVGALILPSDEVSERANSETDDGAAYTDAAQMAEAVIDRAERLAVPGIEGLAPIDSREWALIEVLREHRARLDLVVLYPDSAACEILASSNPTDRADFLENRPGAIDLTAMPLRDAVERVLKHREMFGEGLNGAAPRTLTAALPRDIYQVLAYRTDGTDGDADLTCGVSTVALDCRVPLEARHSAVLDVWHSKVAIGDLDCWEFKVLSPDGGLVPEGTAYTPDQGIYECSGDLELGCDPFELGQAQRLEVTTEHETSVVASARTAGVHLVRIDASTVAQVLPSQLVALLRQHPGSLRIDDAHPYAATDALLSIDARARASFSSAPPGF